MLTPEILAELERSRAQRERADAAEEELRKARLYLKGCMGHFFDETPVSTIAKDVTAEWHRRAIIAQEQRQKIAELEAVVATLSRTEDGARIVPGMTLWRRGWKELDLDGSVYESGPVPAVRRVSGDMVWDGREGAGSGPHSIKGLYSSKEAAEAAGVEDLTTVQNGRTS